MGALRFHQGPLLVAYSGIAAIRTTISYVLLAAFIQRSLSQAFYISPHELFTVPITMVSCLLWTAILAASAVQCVPRGGENATYDYIGKLGLTSLEEL